jgi:hypothetical protein
MSSTASITRFLDGLGACMYFGHSRFELRRSSGLHPEKPRATSSSIIPAVGCRSVQSTGLCLTHGLDARHSMNGVGDVIAGLSARWRGLFSTFSGKNDMEQMNTTVSECLKACLECHQICTETAAHVLHSGGGHSEAKHLVALLDCAQICAVSADFMSRRSPHHAHLCAECAEICEACVVLCESHEDPDGQMARCAQACRRCAKSCDEMGSA